MNFKDLKIGTQLKISFAAMLCFVIVLGGVSLLQTGKINQQTETIYNHPLKVQRALGDFKFDIIALHRDMKDLSLVTDKKDITVEIDWIEWWKLDASRNIDTLYSQYLGPRSDVDTLEQAFNQLCTVCTETIRLLHKGDLPAVYDHTKPSGIVGNKVESLLEKLQTIDDFALNKGNELYINSGKIYDSLSQNLILLVIAIILLSFFVNNLIMRNIRKPLNDLTDAATRFHKGDRNARSSYISKNEFGKLSDSFNNLAANIQLNMDLEDKSSSIIRLMLSEDDAKKFFQTTLSALATYTGAQMAAVYLLSDNKKTYEHFESLGMDDHARKSFDADSLEGEFGLTLTSSKVQHIKNLPEDTRFSFHTVGGKFIPHEMITIPILSGNEIIAIISLASINNLNKHSIQLIDYILDTLITRVEGILAYRKIREFSKELEIQKEEIELAGKYNRCLIEASLDPLVTIGRDGRITDVNNSTEAVTGFPREKLIGTDFARYFTDPELAMAGYQKVFNEGTVHDYELAIRHCSGQITPVLYNATIYRDEAGKVIGVFAAARDITEQKKSDAELHRLNENLAQRSEKMLSANLELEAQKTELSSLSAELSEQNAELEMQKKQLHEASRLKTNFLSNMSHELRTPLNSVIALSGVLNRRLNKKIPAEEYSYLEVIERNGKHLLSLINDILDISRIEAGKEEVEIVEFSVDSLISDVISMIHPQAKQKNIELLQIVSKSDLYITTDADKCRHILQNLIGNAVKFTEHGKVEISVKKNVNNIAITVSDTGIGISEKHQEQIFEEFRQADGSTSRRYGGTGLGLAIAKKYANLLGGTILVKSAPGKGSKFTLLLPLRYTAENRVIQKETISGFNHSIPKAHSKHDNDLSHKTILLVEDSEPAIIQIKDILEESGYHLLVARNGSEGLGIIAQTIPDAMILDLMMPGIDGFEVLKTLREAEVTAHIPVLILTAKHITKEELKFLKQNNIHQLIQKGDVNRNELLNAVASMVLPEIPEKVEPKLKTQTIEGKPVVLVVEDNSDNMTTVKAILSENYKVLEAVDAISGIEMTVKHKPDLILMDIGLPGMDGIAAFKAIRKNTELEHIPVIALTASAMTSDRETILAHGLDAYIAKPIDEKIFFKTINEVLYGN